MPLVTRGGQKNVFVQANEPGIWSQGCVWSDTDNADFFKNVCGTATQVGGAVVTCSTVMAFCQTAGNYTSPCSAAGNSCVGLPDIYNCSTDVTSLNVGACSPCSINAVGAQVCGATNAGKKVKNFEWTISKSGSPTGCAKVSVYDACGVVKSSSAAKAVACMASCAHAETFTFACGQTIAENDHIVLENSGVVGAVNKFLLRVRNTAPPTNWKESNRDLCCVFSCGGNNHGVNAHFNCPATGGAFACGVDCCNCTAWKSASVCNPDIIVDVGSNTLMSGVMLRRGACDTTTCIEIRASTCSCPTACDLIRTVKSACLTADTNKFVRFNVTNARFLMIRGGDACAKVAEFNNIKIEKNTVCEVASQSGRVDISATDCSLALCGT